MDFDDFIYLSHMVRVDQISKTQSWQKKSRMSLKTNKYQFWILAQIQPRLEPAVLIYLSSSSEWGGYSDSLTPAS